MKTSGKKWAKYIDQSIKAKRSGWRKSSVTGERYYEARPDHSDSNPKERYADGGSIKTIKDGADMWYLTYADSTHFFLSNSKDFKGSAYHIGQFRGRPFYNEVNEWLKSETRKKSGLMAKGGKTKKRKDPPIVRGYFDDEPYEYGNGGLTTGFNYSIGGL